MNLPLPIDLEWATGPHPFAVVHDEPGTAIDADAITPAQWEARWLARAAALNPFWNMERPPKAKRGRKPGTGGRSRRPCRIVRGAEHYECNTCHKWLAKTEYYRHADPGSVCGILSCCKVCDVKRRMATKRRQAELCEQEQNT